jgi:hypothetical protein
MAAESSKKHWNVFFKSIQKKEWNKALSALNSLKEADPENPQIHLKAGDVLQRSGDVQGAVAAYHQSASLLIDSGFQQKAIAIFKIILRIAPEDKQALDMSHEILTKEERPKSFLKQHAVETAEDIPVKEDATAVEAASITATSPLETPEEVQPKQPPQEQLDSPAFSSMEKEALEELTSNAQPLSFKHGETIIKEGDRGDSIFVIRGGKARVSSFLLGRPVELAILDEGDIFGEVAFLTGRPRTATVTAEGDLRVLKINRQAIEGAIRKNALVLNMLEDFYSSRVKDTIKLLHNSKETKV